MAELADILLSGDIAEIDLDGMTVKQTLVALELLESINESHGVDLPSISAADAWNNRVFFNTDIDRVCWKSPGGLVFKFRMQLV